MSSGSAAPIFVPEEVLRKGLGSNEVRFWADRGAKDPELYSRIIHIACYDDGIMGTKAAWIVSHMADQAPDLATAHFNLILKSLGNAEGGRLRELFKVLLLGWKTEKQYSSCLDWSFKLISDLSKEIAVMHAAKGFLEQACRRYPELIDEVELHLEAVSQLHGRPWQEQVRKTRERLQKLRLKPSGNKKGTR
ncbi:MAG: hypothetical protein JNM00_14145 [Flavobacteriales bacterium]|nr:hypothetical protein [Flavobacteriales bacterium]